MRVTIYPRASDGKMGKCIQLNQVARAQPFRAGGDVRFTLTADDGVVVYYNPDAVVAVMLEGDGIGA